MNRDYLYGAAFGLMAVAMLAMALRGGWHLLLAWPALSLGAVSIAYLTNDASWFGKRSDGSRSLLATAVLLPYLVLAYAVWRLQISLSREPAISYVNRWLALSRRLRAHEIPDSVNGVCDLTCEFVDPRSVRTRRGYRCHPILDAGACTAAELVDLARRLPPLDGEMLLVHCANGHGRTAMFAAVWLLAHGFATTADDAITMLRNARPGIRLRSRQRRLVEDAESLLTDDARP